MHLDDQVGRVDSPFTAGRHTDVALSLPDGYKGPRARFISDFSKKIEIGGRYNNPIVS